MSFSIILQTNNSADIVLDKDVTDITTLTGTLREGTSIIDPIIRISADLSTLTGCNYMTIPVFGRSYFVRDIKSVVNNIVEISGHVDVLTSFKDSIRACTGIVSRQETDWNLYLNDGTFKVYQNMAVLTRPFPTGFSTYNFVLAVAGG